MTPYMKATFCWLRTLGVEPTLVRIKKHAIVDCKRSDGTCIRLVFPATPSEKRGDLNLRAYARRKLRQ